jgi:cytoskeletal protein RodZ
MSGVINRRQERRRNSRYAAATLQEEQAAKLQMIGAYLRQVREQQAISLEQVEQQTKIQARLLRAIEIGQLDQLPEPVFIQGYIKLFAQVLGLDGSAFAATFPTDAPTQTLLRRSREKSWLRFQLRPIHLYCLYACLIFAAVNGLSYVVGDPSLPDVIEVTKTEQQPLWMSEQSSGAVAARLRPEVANTVTSPTGQGIVDSSQLSSQLQPLVATALSGASPRPLQVAIQLKEQSWLRIEADGQTLFEGVLTEGTEKVWGAEKTMTLRVGNAGGVLVAVNDGQPKPMGEPGAVEEMTIAANPAITPLPNRINTSLPASR